MKIVSYIALVLFFSKACYAADCIVPITLDKVMFQVSAKQWVSTQSALLSISINATLSSSDLVKARSGMMDKLNKIVSGDWQIVQFDRYQDSSGLEKLDVMAQVRVNQSALGHVYDAVKTQSKPGETYLVSAIEFKPSEEDIQKVKTVLRQILNKQVQQELDQLNHTYTEQHFTVNTLSYIDDNEPAPLQVKTMMLASSSGRSTRASAPVAVSQELLMTAVVEAGSNRK